MLPQAFLSGLAKALPKECVITDPSECKVYGSDWTRTPGEAGAIVFPKTTEQVSAVLKLCSEHSIPVVPSGGRTGLSGGAVAKPSELVLNLSRMNQIYPVDKSAETVRVQAGAITENVHSFCATHGLTWPIDLAAKGSSQIGGNLSTNAGGVRVIRYGMARKWVTGLQVVTMDGEILELNRGLEKNNTGYDLVQLIVGSEGTLAVITEATLKLTHIPDPRKVQVLLFSVENIEKIISVLEKVRQGPFTVCAFEFFSAACLNAVEEKLSRKCRLTQRGDYYVLVEAESHDAEKFSAWLSGLLESGAVADGAVARSSEEAKELWGLREGITESLQATASIIRKYDTSVAVPRITDFLKEVQEIIPNSALDLQIFLFGHLGDGSPHVNVLPKDPKHPSNFNAECGRFEKKLFELLKKHGGSLSAEHGVGLQKTEWVKFSRSPAELRLFQGIKNLFDPKGLLNPGKLLPAVIAS